MYTPEAKESPAVKALRDRDVHAIVPRTEEKDPVWTLERLLSSPTIANKWWVTRQYDSTVRSSTVVPPGGADAAIVRVRGTTKALALKTDCNGRYVYLDPRAGGRIAVAEAARNVACAGGRPRAITNCLNFGNPTKPEVFFQFREAVLGMGEACRALETPVTGGNVSFYNENPSGAVFPTPVIGMVGVVEKLEHITRSAFAQDGHAIVLLGENTGELGASEYLSRVHGVTAGAPPACDLPREKATIDALLEAIAAGHVSSAHDCAEGGLAVALAECCIGDANAPVGAQVDLSAWSTLEERALLFGEAQARIIVGTARPEEVIAIAKRHGVPARRIGTVTRSLGSLEVTIGSKKIAAPLTRLAKAYHEAIPNIMSVAVSAVAEPVGT